MPVSPSRPSPEVKPTLEPEQEQKSERSKEPAPAEKDVLVEKAKKPEESAEAMKQPSQYSPDQKPVAPMKGLTGNDRITTQAVSRTQSRGVQLSGETSFEAMGTDMGVYFKNMKERIWLAWFPYLSIHYPKDFRSADVLVRFYLSPAGEVVKVETLNYKGSPLFAAFCMEAVKKAGPYGPVPPDVLALLGQDELEVKFGFHFW
jgi:outer membrane biosynthesis protein TonB